MYERLRWERVAPLLGCVVFGSAVFGCADDGGAEAAESAQQGPTAEPPAITTPMPNATETGVEPEQSVPVAPAPVENDEGGADASVPEGSQPPGPSTPDAASPSEQPATSTTAQSPEPPASSEPSPETPDYVPWPEGSRQLGDVFNLVDPSAVAELDEHLAGEQMHRAFRTGMLETTNQFFSLFEEQYDFLFFIHDHTAESGNAGVFQTVTAAPEVGNGRELLIELAGFQTNGRLKGIAGFDFLSGAMPPFAHEVGHYWLNFLDPNFGFGEPDFPLHWGYSDVNGHLGGYDAATLGCAEPVGAVPPDCTPEESGRVRYVAERFGPHTNSFKGAPFSALELYLMGWAPVETVPESFQLMVGAQAVGQDTETNQLIVEADGMAEVQLSGIIARHGLVEPAAEEDRHLRAAFIVVSQVPAPDEVLEEVDLWAREFGNRGVGVYESFEELASGLATMDTELGPRRRVDDPPPAPRERFLCDAIAQNCPDGLACDVSPPLCMLRADTQRGEPCSSTFTCAKGLDCISVTGEDDDYTCESYCAPDDPNSALSCDVLCPDNLGTYSFEGVVIAGQCGPE